MDQVNPPVVSFSIQSVGVCFWLPIIKNHVHYIVFFLLGIKCSRALKVPELSEHRRVHTTASGLPGRQTRLC